MIVQRNPRLVMRFVHPPHSLEIQLLPLTQDLQTKSSHMQFSIVSLSPFRNNDDSLRPAFLWHHVSDLIAEKI